jgi:DNA-binding CsgD family transcriptional regulator
MWERLTPRQFEICELLCEGYSDAKIAARLGLAVRTVKNYLQAAYHMAGIESETKVSRIALAVMLTYELYPSLCPLPGLHLVVADADTENVYPDFSKQRGQREFFAIDYYRQPKDSVMREAMRSRSAFEPVRLLRDSSDVQPANGKRQDLCMDISAIATNEALGASVVK